MGREGDRRLAGGEEEVAGGWQAGGRMVLHKSVCGGLAEHPCALLRPLHGGLLWVFVPSGSLVFRRELEKGWG